MVLAPVPWRRISREPWPNRRAGVGGEMAVLMHTLHVDLGERGYPIYIGRDLFSDSTLLADHVVGRQVAFPGAIAFFQPQ